MVKRIIFTVLTVLWMIVIFLFSNQPAVKSTNTSQSFIRKTIISVYRIFDSNASDEKLNDIVETFDGPVRKIGHLIEYFIFGILVYVMLKSYGIKNVYVAIIFCFLYSCSDEIHQMFIGGRSCEIRDIIIDTFGSFSSIMIMKRCNK